MWLECGTCNCIPGKQARGSELWVDRQILQAAAIDCGQVPWAALWSTGGLALCASASKWKQMGRCCRWVGAVLGHYRVWAQDPWCRQGASWEKKQQVWPPAGFPRKYICFKQVLKWCSHDNRTLQPLKLQSSCRQPESWSHECGDTVTVATLRTGHNFERLLNKWLLSKDFLYFSVIFVQYLLFFWQGPVARRCCQVMSNIDTG